jgi:hypothetical protein
MQSRTAYLAWVRSRYPKVYWSALKAVFTPQQSALGSLGDDLTSSVTPDLTASTDLTGDLSPDISSSTSDAVNAAYNATVSPSSSGTDTASIFNSVANAISSIGQSVVTTQAEQNLLSINTQRARQGLPPLSANGLPVTASGLVPTSATIAQIEASLGGSSGMALLGVGIAAVLGLALLSRKSR